MDAMKEKTRAVLVKVKEESAKRVEDLRVELLMANHRTTEFSESLDEARQERYRLEDLFAKKETEMHDAHREHVDTLQEKARTFLQRLKAQGEERVGI